MLISEELHIGADSSSNKNEEHAFYSNRSRGRGRGRYGRGRGRNNNDAYACNANNDARPTRERGRGFASSNDSGDCFYCGKSGHYAKDYYKNKHISEVESYNMVTMHLAIMMIIQKSYLLCNIRCTLLLWRMICMMMYGMWTQVHQIT